MNRSTLAICVIVLAAGCLEQTSSPASSTPAPKAVPNRPAIVLPDGFEVHVEIAADDDTRQQGLMYRDHLAESSGMIFLFPKTGEYPFWMKNTFIALDMIWINDQKVVVHVESAVQPCPADPCPSYPPHADARYVLELASGVASRHRLAAGQVLRFVRIDNVVVR